LLRNDYVIIVFIDLVLDNVITIILKTPMIYCDIIEERPPTQQTVRVIKLYAFIVLLFSLGRFQNRVIQLFRQYIMNSYYRTNYTEIKFTFRYLQIGVFFFFNIRVSVKTMVYCTYVMRV